MAGQAFQDGARVHLAGRNGTFYVRTGRPDSDHEIKVYDRPERDHGDWSYIHVSQVSLADQPSVACPHNAEPCTGEAINSNQEAGTSAMSNTARSIVHVVLIDQDAGLDPTKALVKDFGQHVLQGSQEDLKMELVMNNNMESILNAHNIVRSKEIDLDILNRTGNEVKLLPRKLGELTWKIGTVA